MFYKNLGLPLRSTKRFVVIVGTGASSSFIRLIEIPQSMKYEILKLDSALNIRTASGKAVIIL